MTTDPLHIAGLRATPPRQLRPVVYSIDFGHDIPPADDGTIQGTLALRPPPFACNRLQATFNGHTEAVGDGLYPEFGNGPLTAIERRIVDGVLLKLPSEMGTVPLRPLVQERDEQCYDDITDEPLFDDEGEPIMRREWGFRLTTPVLFRGGESLRFELRIDPGTQLGGEWRIMLVFSGVEHC